ncbi:MAG TPA: Gfo/Idh/MocA family oxidoreductase [Nocardioides sp.]|uniref:Gfo/Idh/MocA family protein n=1 Tax=Nocardioides sp. TaxID=35761 RepID=UPI002F41B92D
MSSPEAVRVGVIGLGAMGAAHVETLERWVPGASVAQVFDVDVGRARAIGERCGAAVAASAEELIASAGVDAVLVAAPDPLHESLALTCLAADKPTLLEKPIATTPEGARRVVEAEVAGGRRLIQLGFMRRFDPAYVDLREAVAGGAVGTVRAVHCVHRNAQAHPSHTSDSVLVNSMIHELDCVPWLLDDPLTSVTVFASRVGAGALEDLQVAVLETRGGVVVTVEVYVNARYGYDIHTEIVGTAGTVSLTPPYGVSVRRGLSDTAGVDGRVVDGGWTSRFLDAYRIELGAWIDGIRSGRPVGPSAWDGHLADLAAFAAVASRQGGGRVTIPQEECPELYA